MQRVIILHANDIHGRIADHRPVRVVMGRLQ